MTLSSYWPTVAEVNECIKPEAESATDAVLLAVHQPSPLSYRAVNSDKRVATTEEELIRFFMTPNVPTGAHLLPITGASGVGKSHLIRLLHARLSSSEAASRYLIIRIPKSASLRRVVELILEHLPEHQYGTVKDAFKNALAEVHIATAAMRFQIELEIGLNAYSKELRGRLEGDPANQSLKEQLHHAQLLPLLLTDAVTVEHFRTTVLPRIVQRAVSGRSIDSESDPADAQFRGEDLDLPIEIEIGKAAHSVALYYKTQLLARQGKGKHVAAGVLNAVIDQATRQLFQLHEALGGMTLQDVILEIRRLLLLERKELVVLVEDFAALTGIQETLLKVLIQEGVREGVKTYATMRSAIAVTDGYLIGRDTILTRAMREWIVESNLDSEDEVLSRTTALVASYLNTARWGHKAVAQQYTARPDLTALDWLPAFEAENHDDFAKLLSGFGSRKGVSLFPYTVDAIECLARAALTKGDTLVFNPRFVINDVLRKVLLAGREAFLGATFPPVGIEVGRPSAEVAQWLAKLRVSDAQRQRYERLVVIWGNSPSTVQDIGRIPQTVFEAFSLSPPEIAPGPRAPVVRPPISRPDPVQTDGTQLAEMKRIQDALENWVQRDVQLDQDIASVIRRELADALGRRIDWNGERRLKQEIRPNQVSIPKSRGEGNLPQDAIRLSNDNSDREGKLRAELAALVRFSHVYKKRLVYEGVDDDLARIGNLVDRLVPQAMDLVKRSSEIKLRASVAALAANSRLIGSPEKGRTPGALATFLFGDPAVSVGEQLPDTAPAALREWREMQQEAVRVRSDLISLVHANCGCFQGVGKTPNGIDILEIVGAFPAEDYHLELATLDPIGTDLRQSLSNLSEVRVKTRVKATLIELGRTRKLIETSCGKDFDKNVVADKMKALAEALKELGAWVDTDIGASVAQFRSFCEEFRSTPIKEVLAQMDRLETEDESAADGAKAISRVSQISFTPVLTTLRVVQIGTALVRQADRQARALEEQFKGVDPKAEAEAISKLFDEVPVLLSELQYKES